MRQHCVLSPPESLGGLSDDSLSISLLNTRSLKLHVADIVCDKDMIASDILCLTETQLLPDQNIYDICSVLEDFQVYFNNNNDKFKSIACAVKNPTLTTSHDEFPGFSVLKICKQSFLEYDIILGILYRKHSSALHLFYDNIRTLIDTYGITILLGDFNINYFDNQDVLTETLSDFEMIVNTPTHIDGSLLDHIYLKKQLVSDFDFSSTVKSIFFSDHDVVKVKITKKQF